MLLAVLLVLLVLAFFGAIPTWHWHSYGWTPSGVLLVVAVVVLILWIRDRRDL